MNKKLLLGIAALATCGLAACGGNSSAAPVPTPTPTPTPSSSTGTGTGSSSTGFGYDTTVRGEEGKVWTLAGQLKDRELDPIDWDGSNPDGYMQANSIAGVAELLGNDVADKLVAKGAALQYIYTYEGVGVGAGDAGWNTKALVDGEVVQLDGSFCLKAIEGSYDEDLELFVKEQWIPDPHTAHAEALTDDLFIPPWQEEIDEHGFSWADNSVVIGEAGIYNVVVVKYTNVSTAEDAGFGMGIVRTGDLPINE